MHSRVDSVEKRLNATGNVLTLKCKDFVLLQLDIPSSEDCINVASSIEQLSNIGIRFLMTLYSAGVDRPPYLKMYFHA